MSAKKVSSLGLVFTVAAASAALAFFFWPKALPVAERLMLVKSSKTPAFDAFMAYTVLFVGAFFLLSFIGHHVALRVSWRALGYERTAGAAAKFSRLMLVSMFFILPATFLSRDSGIFGMMLDYRKEKIQVEAPVKEETGYKPEDREKMEELIHKGAQDD